MNTERARVRSQIGPHSIFPHWVMESGISYFEVCLYLQLQKHADYATGECWPLRTTLATDLQAALSTVDAGLAALKRIGAITITKRSNGFGKPQTNIYTVIMAKPLATETAPAEVVEKPSKTPTTSGQSVVVEKQAQFATTTAQAEVPPPPPRRRHRSKGSNEIQVRTPLTPRDAGGTAAPATRQTRAERKAADRDEQEAHRDHLRAEREAQLLREAKAGRQRLDEARVAIAAMSGAVRDHLWTLTRQAYPLARNAPEALATVLVERARGRTIPMAVAELTAAVTQAA